MSMPYGYRWIVKEDFNGSDYAKASFLPHEGGTIVPWDCMVEFGMDHDHDPVECERMMALMGDDDGYDDTDYSGWYGGERGYNDGLRWSDFV